MRRDRRVPRRQRGPHIYARGGSLWAYLDRDTRVSLETADPAEARARFARKLDEHAKGAARRRPGEKSLDVIAEDYLDAPHGWSRRTKHTTRLRVTAFVEAMAALDVTHPSLITPAALDAWRTPRMATRSRVTINRDEIVAKRMLAWAAATGRCAPTPLVERKALKEPRRKPPPIIPSPAEVSSVVAALEGLGEHGAALTIATALATGKRLDELRHMETTNVGRGTVSVVPELGPAAEAWQSKSYKERTIPVSANAARVATEFVAWRMGKGGKGKAVGLSDSWIAGKIDAGREACTPVVPKFRMHDLRRTFATECVRAGIPITTVRDWLGHRDVSTTERYLGRYRSDADMVAPTPAALDVLGRTPAKVLSMTTKKGAN
jgi:integrase